MNNEEDKKTNDVQTARWLLTDKQYNLAKFLTVTVVPATGTLYFALAVIWNFPAGQQVLGTLLSIEAFLAVLLGISSKQYNNSDARFSGDINVIQGEDKTTYSLELNHSPEELEAKKEAIFKVNSPK
jgi:hypothetical protein